MSSTGMSLRTTQRAPRSCLSCASRKVKCDKSVPCSRCIKRGQADACVREMVIIRGEVTMWQDGPHVLTYEELRRENQRLRREISVLRAERGELPQSNARPVTLESIKEFQYSNGLEEQLWQSISTTPETRASSTILHWNDIILPSPACSDRLIAYDRIWNSWVHYALEYPHFGNECTVFMGSMEENSSLDKADASWMAVYFSVLSTALLMMDDAEAENLPLPDGINHQEASANWYHAAIFCLHKADFMRIPSIRSVQAIAILGISFNNRGDSELGEHLWSSTIRIAQRIGLDQGYSEMASSCLSAEGQHRLWWTLVICDWLTLSYRPPRVHDADFDVPLPSATSTDEEENVTHPVHYHIFMARTSTIFYYFRQAIRSGPASLAEMAQVVRKADEELAEIIDTLPAHLRPDADGNDEIRRLELAQPWIKWQRFDLTLVLLHLRLQINCTLQKQWLSYPGQYDWARTISVRSAMSIVWINRNWDQPISMRKQWALSYHVFASALALLSECRSDPCTEDEEYTETIQGAVELLDNIKEHSAVAYHAARILRENMVQGSHTDGSLD
ncbi:Zn(2)-C6 fungal-type domain-containing protein [Fusarium keratoplasticum]|uniref:Zn(2)-C6 fungal-type domain-containing protein n=1 Tax=Fusarium keratoplasticum TaxID=1328300 RepID=A0ACC0QBN4_9HYPO|nr:Zn(2)-C6 fungal-type domain-containing protein [Fusarium keratoplasticum]KAI8649210.1 Zn(2)-C6 fungal-type domain-containing protein [Fusarium keratoplasticum]KAI8649602.1 Zn(2)-C6 fungal-type domain-containing protein [Fusarium keratoplasticum]